MTNPKDPYASEAETQALLVPDTRTAAERKLAQMMAERGADEQGAEAYPILLQIALDLLESKQTFTGLPKRKLNELLSAGWQINGVSIEREEGAVTKRGAVTTGGMVLWWNQEQPAQPQDSGLTNRYTAPQPAQQEPVALPCCGYTDASAVKWNPYNQVLQCHNCGQVYTSPPAQRKPLTDEQLSAIGSKIFPSTWNIRHVELVRAIEAAHNIKENT